MGRTRKFPRRSKCLPGHQATRLSIQAGLGDRNVLAAPRVLPPASGPARRSRRAPFRRRRTCQLGFGLQPIVEITSVFPISGFEQLIGTLRHHVAGEDGGR
jgi:hypothetical protein